MHDNYYGLDTIVCSCADVLLAVENDVIMKCDLGILRSCDHGPHILTEQTIMINSDLTTFLYKCTASVTST